MTDRILMALVIGMALVTALFMVIMLPDVLTTR